MMKNLTLDRRGFLATTALAGTAFLPAATVARASDGGGYVFEVTKTEDEWRAILTNDQYDILRDNGTEWPGSSAYWDDYAEGAFHCAGCDLHVYDSEWRVELDKGWVFFAHAQPNAVLTDIDKAANYSMNPDNKRTLMEVHCRRCGGHMGHIVNIERQMVHCINGTSLNRKTKST